MSVDPLAPDYPSLTPYQFSSNSPIANIDLDGLEATQSITYKASNGTSLVLPSEATVVISTGDIANHPGATVPEGGDFGTLFPQGTVGAFTVDGKEYRAAYDGDKFTGYYNPSSEQYYESKVLIDLPVISVFDGYQPLFDQADGAIFNDPLNGGANDLVQTADLLSDINPGKAAAGVGISIAVAAMVKIAKKQLKDYKTYREVIKKNPSVKDAVKGLKRQIKEHRQKLRQYKKDPVSADNKGMLAKAPTEEIRQKIISSRIKSLTHQMNTFKKDIKLLKSGEKTTLPKQKKSRKK